jgi:hypothetical protein
MNNVVLLAYGNGKEKSREFMSVAYHGTLAGFSTPAESVVL